MLGKLGWKALARPTTDYTAFVHLIDDKGQIITQHDAPPGGQENPTRLWAPGETVRSSFILELPEGVNAAGTRLGIGLYEPVGGKQLPVTATADDLRPSRECLDPVSGRCANRGFAIAKKQMLQTLSATIEPIEFRSQNG